MTDFKDMEDRELVTRLLENDQQAWEYVLLTVVMRIVNQRKNSEMIFRRSYDPMDVIGDLYEYLAENDFARLRAFEFRGSFDGWLRTAVRSAVQRVTGITGSGGDKLSKIDREILVNPLDPATVITFAEQPVSSTSLHLMIMDKRMAFSKFWKENPESAFIIFMRNELEMSADDVGLLLDRPANTIVQKAKRAAARLLELEKE